MKKLSIALILIAVLVLLAMPFLTGMIAEKVTYRLVDKINTESGKSGQLSISSYQRHLRNSESSFVWAPVGSASYATASPFEFRCNGKHNLLSYTFWCKAQNMQRYTEFVNRELNGVDPLTVGGEVSIFGVLTQQISVDAFELRMAEGDTLQVAPATIAITSDSDLEDFEVDGELPSLSARGPAGLLTLNNFSVNGDFSINRQRLVIGNLSIALETAKLTSFEQGDVSLNGLSMISNVDERGENLQFNQRLHLEKLSWGSAEAEPSSMQNLSLDIYLDGIDMLKLAMLKDKLVALSGKRDTSINASLLQMVPNFEKLLIPGLALKTSISADYQLERLSHELDLLLMGKLSFSDILLLKVNPNSVFRKIRLKLDTKVPQSLLAQHPQSELAFSSSPWYLKEAPGYTLNFQMQDDGINLNGQQISAEALLQLMKQ